MSYNYIEYEDDKGRRLASSAKIVKKGNNSDLYVDGQLFPWFTSSDPKQVEAALGTTHLTLTLKIAGPVEIVHESPEILSGKVPTISTPKKVKRSVWRKIKDKLS